MISTDNPDETDYTNLIKKYSKVYVVDDTAGYEAIFITDTTDGDGSYIPYEFDEPIQHQIHQKSHLQKHLQKQAFKAIQKRHSMKGRR